MSGMPIEKWSTQIGDRPPDPGTNVLTGIGTANANVTPDRLNVGTAMPPFATKLMAVAYFAGPTALTAADLAGLISTASHATLSAAATAGPIQSLAAELAGPTITHTPLAVTQTSPANHALKSGSQAHLQGRDRTNVHA